jgi:hypothetical protein
MWSRLQSTVQQPIRRWAGRLESTDRNDTTIAPLWRLGLGPRLFHSMRASRQTELQREFSLHVVCSWLGNSPLIAQQSYLLVTEEDFAKAAGVAKVSAKR